MKKVTALSKIGLGELCAKNDGFYDVFFFVAYAPPLWRISKTATTDLRY